MFTLHRILLLSLSLSLVMACSGDDLPIAPSENEGMTNPGTGRCRYRGIRAGGIRRGILAQRFGIHFGLPGPRYSEIRARDGR